MSDEVLARLDALTSLVAKLAPAPTPTVSVGEVANDYMRSIEFTSLRAKKTEEGRIRLHIKRLLGHVPAMELLAHIDTYRDTRRGEQLHGRRKPTTPATRNREVVRMLAMCSWAVARKLLPSNPLAMLAMCSWAVARKLLPSNPLAGVMMEPEDNVRQTCPTPLDVHAIIAEAKGRRLKAMIATKFSGGFRRGELVGLRQRQVSFDDGIIDLGAADTKTRRPRITFLTEVAAILLRDYLDNRDVESTYLFCTRSGRPVSGRNFLRDFQATCARAGIVAAEGERMCVHDLRAGFAARELTEKTPERVVMDMGGWKSHAAFDRYVRVKKDWVLDAKRRADEAEKRRGPVRTRKPQKKEVDQNEDSALGSSLSRS